ncbi:restriction endonuclease [Thermodesulfobacteriota bacterium]
MCAFRIVQHLTEIYYHDIEHDSDFDEQLKNLKDLQSGPPSSKPEIPEKSLLPNRGAISDLMAQLPASDFPELIEQILIQNYNHTRGDITDGPGDQSRDIHTITPDSEKHLTQCRHTENPHRANLDRHDLDELWAATGRLRYEHGLLVTNADMTTPSKTSFRNGVYSREGYPELSVWNDRDLWDEIRNNQNILNRWFSGLAQLHSVKRFSFRVLPAKMPDREPTEIKTCIDGFVTELKEQGFTAEQTGLSWKIENDDVIIFMREWFASAANLFMPCALKAPHDLMTAPFSILEFHVINKTNQANHDAIREFLCSILLKNYENKDGNWTTLLVSSLMAPVYIHDTEDVIVSLIKPHTSFILANNDCVNELSAATLTPAEYTTQSDDELILIHNETGIIFSVNYSQPVEESRDDTLKIISLKAQETFRKSLVFEVSYKNKFEFSMALASVNFTNLVLEDSDDKKLYFCFVKGENKDNLKADLSEFLHSLKLQNINSRVFEPDDLIEMNERLQNELQFEVQTDRACHTKSDLIVPIDFRSRVTTSMAEIDISNFSPDYENLAFELFKYKMQEQHKCGFDEGFNVGDNKMTFRQLRNILWRHTKMTGRESINIGIKNNSDPIRLMIYFKPNRMEALSDSLKRCHDRTLEHIENIKDLITKIQSS